MQPLVPRLSPNPVRSSSELTFLTTRAGPLVVGLYDLAGRRLSLLMSAPNAPAGLYRLLLAIGDHGAAALPSGICFVRVHAAEGTAIGRFAVIR